MDTDVSGGAGWSAAQGSRASWTQPVWSATDIKDGFKKCILKFIKNDTKLRGKAKAPFPGNSPRLLLLLLLPWRGLLTGSSQRKALLPA